MQASLKSMVSEYEQPFYTERMASVEIMRNGRLERLHFRLPEVAVINKDNAAFLQSLDDKLFNVNTCVFACVCMAHVLIYFQIYSARARVYFASLFQELRRRVSICSSSITLYAYAHAHV